MWLGINRPNKNECNSLRRRFVHGFADIAHSLHTLAQVKDAEFSWTAEANCAFAKLKERLTTAPVLGYPNPEGEFVLDTDASSFGLGAVLSQLQNNEEVVIAYYSRTLSRSEVNYCATPKELLAVVQSIKHSHPYLYGRRFRVRSDHASLQWILNFKRPEGQLARWMEVLQMYDFTIEHRAGLKH